MINMDDTSLERLREWQALLKDGDIIINVKNNKIIKKNVIKPGIAKIYPALNAECHIKITDVYSEVNNDLGHEKGSFFFGGEFMGHFIFGYSAHFLDVDFEKCINRMCVGEIAFVSLIYCDDDYKPALTVTCCVQIIEYEQIPIFCQWEWQKKVAYSAEFKETGMLLMKNKKTHEAFIKFSRALKVLLSVDDDNMKTMTEEQRTTINGDKVKLYNNIAYCQLLFDQHSEVVSLCTKALAIDKDNVKSLYRRGTAYMCQEEWDLAQTDMNRVVTLDPTVTEAKEKLIIIRKQVQKSNETYKKTIQNMFGN